MNPQISIIVPVYKVEPYIRRCVDSILSQTFTDFELILVDDGSPDGCPAICDEYAQKDDRIRVIHKKNGGLSDARNAGLDIAIGEFIGFIDSDDWVASNMYEIMLSEISKNNADIVVCGINYTDNNELIRSTQYNIENNIVYYRHDFIDNFYCYARNYIFTSVCNKLIKSNFFSKVRFPVGHIYEDEYVLLDLLDLSSKVVVCKENLYFYRTNREGSIINTSFDKKRFDKIRTCIYEYDFMRKKHIINEENLALDYYVTYYLQNYFAVRFSYRNYEKDFFQYKIQFKLLLDKLLRNPKICKLKKLVMLLIFISPKTALRLCRKYFPECLYAFMR